MGRPTFKLRGKLLGGVCAILFPLLAVLLFGIWQYYQLRKELLLEGLQQTTQTAGIVVDRALEANRTLAHTLASANEVSTLEAAQARALFQRISEARPELLNLSLVHQDGAVVASLREVAEGLNVADRPYFQEAVSSGRPVLSPVLLSRTQARAVAAAASPIVDEGGAVRGVAVVAFRVETLSKLLDDVRLREGQELFVTDRQGTLAFHTAMPEPTWAQRDLSSTPEVRRALAGETVESTRFSGIHEGDTRIAAMSATPVHGWIVGITWNSREAFRELNEVLVAQLVTFLVVAAVAFVGGWALTRYLVGRLGALIGMTRALGAGRLGVSALPPVRTGGDEIDELTGAFSTTAAELLSERARRETFVASVAHDLKNLTTPLSVTAQSLTRQGALGEEAKQRMAARLENQTRRIQRLVSDLLDATRIDTGHFDVVREPQDLAKLVRVVCDDQRHITPDRTIILTAPEHLPLEADGQRLSQVLTNLVNNAVKYSPEGGEVRVEVSCDPEEARVSVSDQGIGLASHELQPVFDAYNRAGGAQIRGLGLGLYISKAIIKAHGGWITVESGGPGRGATFRFGIPRAAAGPIKER